MTAHKGSQEFTVAGTYQFYIPPTASTFFIEAIGAGGGGSSGRYASAQGSGAGGGSGAYNSWMIRKEELSNAAFMNITVGAGGKGGNNRGMSLSTDGIVWTHVQSGPGFGVGAIYTLMYDGTNYFAAGDAGVLTTSTNGIFWFQRTAGTQSTVPIGYTAGGSGLLYAAGQTNPYVLSGSSGILSSSTDGITWTSRTSGAGTNAVRALAFGSSVYLRAVGADIATSTDTISWSQRTTGNATAIQSLLYSNATNEYYLNCRAGGELQTSTDVIVWILRTSGTTAALRQLLYADVYIVSGDSGVLNTSTNAIEWTLRTSGTTSALYGLSYTSGSYIAAGASGTLISSTDTITWTARSSLFKLQTIHALTYGSYFVAGGVVGGSGANGTDSTVTWTGFTPTATSTYTLASDNGRGAADSTVGAVGGVVAAITLNPYYRVAGLPGGDGLADYAATNNSPQTDVNQISGGGGGAYNTNTGGSGTTYYYGNTYTNGGDSSGGNALDGIPGFYTGNIGGGGGGGGSVSSGFNSWYLRTTPFGANAIYTSMYDGTNYWIGGAAGLLASSTDTISWTLRTSGTTLQLGYSLGGNGFAYASGQPYPYVYCGYTINNTNVKSSTDGIVWVTRTVINNNTTVAFGNLPTPTYVTCNGVTGLIYTSTDTITWSPRTSSNGNALNHLYYSGASPDYYLNCRGAGAIQTSTNALVWTNRTSGTTSSLYQLVYGNIYVSAGAAGALITSTDAITWTLRTSGTGVDIFGLSFSNASNLYLAAGSAANARYSTDGIVWIARTTKISAANAFQTTTVGNNGFIVGGGGVSLSALPSIATSSAAGNGGNGTRGGGGGGGGYSYELNRFGIGGDGGDGYVKITWW